jgi:Subtilase family
MPSPRLALLGLTLVAAIAISSATSVAPSMHLRAATPPGTAQLMVFGGRSAQQLAGTAAKLDAALADLVRHAYRARADHALQDLHSLSPAARFSPGPDGGALVAVDAVTRGDPQRLKAALLGLGMQRVAVYGNDVGGLLPVSQISAAAARDELVSLRAAMWRTRAGPVTSQGDFAQGSVALRAANPSVTGAGVTVGVISDSFNCYAYYAANPASYTQFGISSYHPQPPNGIANPPDATQDEASGALPASVHVVQEADCANFGGPLQLPDSDEGRAMLQIVHDVAPGASLAFYGLTGSEADFANGVTALANAGARVEADDVGFFDEPFFQDGIISQAIDAVATRATNPVAYFTAAGNNGGGNLAYENTTPSFSTLSTSAPNQGEMLLNFDPSGATTTVSLPITVAALQPGEIVALVVEWDQPYATNSSDLIGDGPGATSQIDVCVSSPSGGYAILNLDGQAASCTLANAVGTDPVQVMIVANPANSGLVNTSQEAMSLQIGLVNGTAPPGRIKVVLEDDGAGSSIDQFNTSSPTIQGHANDTNAGTVGAAFYGHTPRCGVTPAVLASYSSAGGDPVLFDAAGNAQTAVIRQKPDFVGPDGVNNTFLGQPGTFGYTNGISQCEINGAFPSFFGTSAATPHVAAVAALLMQYNSGLTPAQIYTVLHNTASPIGATPNLNAGYGFIQADQAIKQVSPGAAPPPPTGGGGHGGGGLDSATLLALAGLLGLRLLWAARASRRVQRAPLRTSPKK